MGKILSHSTTLFVVVVLLSICDSEQLQSSQALTLLRIQQLLNFPDILSSWNSSTDFCHADPSPSLTVVCYEESITQLHIIGEKGVSSLDGNFSIDSFITTLVRLPSLKVLTLASLGLWGPLPAKIARLTSLEILNISSNSFYGAIPKEISSLKALQTLILDENRFSGQLPDWLGSLPVLSVLSLKKNLLVGSLPDSLQSLVTLRVVALSHNHFTGEVPDLSTLTNLQVLDLEDNFLGPKFPQLSHSLVTLVLRKNRFLSAITPSINFFYQLQRLDLSFNKFIGPFPKELLSLPAITNLSIAGNRFTGMLFENQSCNSGLEYVDLSMNLLTGSLPSSLLSDSKNRVVLYDGNCFATNNRKQQPVSFCQNEALAVGIFPAQPKRARGGSKAVLSLGVVSGIIGGTALIGLLFLAARKVNARSTIKSPPTRLIAEIATTGYSSKFLSDARYISQKMKMGAIGLPAYRTFSLQELEEVTNNFDTSTFMGEDSHGQMYRGQMKDGSFIAIRCMKMKKTHGTQSFMRYIELTAKLRHQHLVSALGHCLDCYLDDSSVGRVFLVFEYVPNDTLRGWISAEGCSRPPLTWPQRIVATIGVAKGIQFLQTGIVPGVLSNQLKITDILLDQNLVAKISSYNLLPLQTENSGKVSPPGGSKEEYTTVRGKHGDKTGVYDLGVILLEIIVGKPFDLGNEVDAKEQLQASIMGDEEARRRLVDPVARTGCSDESLKMMMEICVQCLHEDPDERPSVDDVLWKLQFAAQVQGESHSGGGSPAQPSQSSPPQLTFQ